MRQRENYCGLATPHHTQGLICPVIFSDSKNFPAEAQTTQAKNLKPWNRQDRSFKRTKKYGGLRDAMEKLAIELADLLPDVPPWDPDWPIVRPEPPVSLPPENPEL